MKTSFIIAVMIVLHRVPKTKGKEKFECPDDCPPNVYQPVCSRGKSYANLCVLKQEICKGKTAREIYDDMEACPGYEKEEDASGKSVEAIDKNGVLFRHLNVSPKKINIVSTERSKHSSSIIRNMKKSYYAKRGKKSEQSKRCPVPCSYPARSVLPLCILGNEFSVDCPYQLIPCQSFLPIIPIFIMDRNQKSRYTLNPSRTKESSLINRLKMKRSKNRASDIDTKFDRKSCKINCDLNEYRPVCTGKWTFRSECYLKKAICSGSIDKDTLKTAKTCPQAQNKRKRNKN